MAAPFHNVLSKLDRALVAYIIAQSAGVAADTVPGKLSLDKPLPLTVCSSEQASELPEAPYSAVFKVDSAIIEKSEAAIDAGAADSAPKGATEDRVAKTFDCFYTDVDSAGDKLAADITAAARATADADLADFTVINVSVKNVQAGFDEEGSAWMDTMNLEVICCPKNVT
jgi:hypothetical protein